VDALFEAMSGMTTTGSSVVADVSTLDKSLSMWRQFTQWFGGMGIIVLALAVLPRLRVGGRQLMESEAPGRARGPDRVHRATLASALYVALGAPLLFSPPG
jgi:Trk-type K+ transport system membrane component